MSKFRSVLVSESGLELVANQLNLGENLIIGKGEETSGGREKASLLANATEALFAAIYVDSKAEQGLGEITRIIKRLFQPHIKESEDSFQDDDFKTDLQEWAQRLKMGEIKYEVAKEEGPDHEKTFYINLTIGGALMGQGQGKSKKNAEQQAALEALKVHRKS